MQCDISDYGLSLDPLCDFNKEPKATSAVDVNKLTLTGTSGRFEEPTTVHKDWYYASVLIVCETEISGE